MSERAISRDRPPIPLAEVHHDRGTVTFAVTFKWKKPWAMDHCEVGVISGEMRRTLAAHFDGYEQLESLVAVETWEPNEERWIGNQIGATNLHQIRHPRKVF